MSFAQLEEAARNSIDPTAEDGDPKGKSGASKGKKPGVKQVQARDDEMQIYLSDIRQKQENLINRLRQDS